MSTATLSRAPSVPVPSQALSPEGGGAARRAQQLVTVLLVFGPLVAVGLFSGGVFGRRVSLLDLLLAVGFFMLSGHGVTAGFHRLLTHRSFRAARWLKIGLALAGSLALEGSVISWVANHRRHHAYTDRPGDPHSPFEYGPSAWGQLRGAVHAHMGWLFNLQPTEELRWAPDLVRDPDLVVISRLFPVMVVASLGAPMLIGWALTGTWIGALDASLWGGAVRIFVLHQATFAVNSVCHLWGRRPFITRETDRARNFAPLAVVSMGESWHNFHHSFPASARHGVDRGQLDSTARLIRWFELLGAAHDVRWPSPDAVERRRRQALIR